MKLTGRLGTENPAALDKAHFSAQHLMIPRIWAVVADNGGARVLKRSGGHLEMLGEILPGQEMEAKIGRGEGTVHHHDKPDEGNGTIRERLGGYFAHQLADWLDNAVREDAFDKLVIAAPPHMLGILRKAISRPVHDRIIMEINKDFMKHDMADLENDLSEVMWP